MTIPPRDGAFISTKYENRWGYVRDFVRWLRDSSVANFESVFNQAQQFTNGVWDADDPALAAGESAFILNGIEVRMPLMACEYLWRDLVAYEVMRNAGARLDVVAELGSGWSANIFNLWLRGASPGATYYGCEYTVAGREAGLAIAGTRPGTAYIAQAFDWNTADFAFLPAQAKHVLVYSCHSIEQIPELSLDVLRRLLARTAAAATLRGVFIEPVGWQYAELAADSQLLRDSRAYVEAQDYNRNLRQILEALVADGLIRIDRVAVNAFGTAINPSTVIHWRRL